MTWQDPCSGRTALIRNRGTDRAPTPPTQMPQQCLTREVERMGAVVAITHDLAIERGIAEALGHLPLDGIVRGKLVAVKPNETWASPETPA
jgi:hypothetical protein